MNNKIKKFLPGLFLVALFAFSPFSASATEVYVIDLGGGNCRVIVCEDGGGNCSESDGTWSQSGGEKYCALGLIGVDSSSDGNTATYTVYSNASSFAKKFVEFLSLMVSGSVVSQNQN